MSSTKAELELEERAEGKSLYITIPITNWWW